jgi:flagellar FliL protein
MADEQDIDMTDPQQSGKKRLFIVIGVVALISLLSIGGVLFLVLGGDDDAPAEEEVAEEPVKQPAMYMEIEPAFVVTYKVGMRQRYLQVYVSLMVRDAVLLEGLKNNTPALKSALLQTFGEQDFNELKTPEGKEKLRSLALDTVNKVVADNIGEGTVEKVLFTNIVMQ